MTVKVPNRPGNCGPRRANAGLHQQPKPDKPALDGVRREGATPAQTVGTYLNLPESRARDE